MTDASLLGLVSQAGPLGLIIAYLVWDGGRRDIAKEKADAARQTYDDKRLEADKQLAASLAALTITIQQLPRS